MIMRVDYPISLRVWHWLNAIAVSGLLLTFFLRKTFLSWRENSVIIIDKFSSMGIQISEEQAKIVAKAIRAPMWEWHIIFGLILAALLMMRAWIFWQEAGFGYDDEDEGLHMRLVHGGYKLIYIILIFMAISGIALNWHETFGISESVTHTIKEIHEYVAWLVVIFVPLHIVGVFVAENDDQRGIVSRMISG